MAKLTLKTWDEWESDGLHVIKGQKAVGYDKNNKALFSERQVTKTVHHRYGYDYTNDRARAEYKPEPEPERVYFADGSGYVNYGGPCGPLYFDRNGNT